MRIDRVLSPGFLTRALRADALAAAPTGPFSTPCATLAVGVAAMPRPSSHRASAGTRAPRLASPRLAESSITELAQIDTLAAY
jgi:hypothetical protein